VELTIGSRLEIDDDSCPKGRMWNMECGMYEINNHQCRAGRDHDDHDVPGAAFVVLG
jgi:hypothetical protein